MQLSSTNHLSFPTNCHFLDNNASSQYKISPQIQYKLANQNAEFIIEISRRFSLDYTIPTTALKLSAKFFNSCSYYQYDRLIVLGACFLLAAKMHDKHFRIFEIACVFYRVVVDGVDNETLKKVVKEYEKEIEKIRKQEKQRQKGEPKSKLKVITKQEKSEEKESKRTPEEEEKLTTMKGIIEEIGDQIAIAESSVLKVLCFQIYQKSPIQFLDQYLKQFYPYTDKEIIKRIEFCSRIIIMDSQRIQTSLQFTPLITFISALLIASDYFDQKPYAYLKGQKEENADKSDYYLYNQWLQNLSEVEGQNVTRRKIIECIEMLNWLVTSLSK